MNEDPWEKRERGIAVMRRISENLKNSGDTRRSVALQIAALDAEVESLTKSAEKVAESGEIESLRYRLQIAEEAWTRARMDTDAMTREIEGLKGALDLAAETNVKLGATLQAAWDEVRRLKGEEENERVTLTVEQKVIRDGIWSERQPETLREYRRALNFAMGEN